MLTNSHYLTSTKLLDNVTFADTPSPFYEQCGLPSPILLPIKQLRVYLPSHKPVISHFQAVLHPEISHFQRLFNAKISHFQPLTDCKVSAKKRHLQELAAFSCVFSETLQRLTKREFDITTEGDFVGQQLITTIDNNIVTTTDNKYELALSRFYKNGRLRRIITN